MMLVYQPRKRYRRPEDRSRFTRHFREAAVRVFPFCAWCGEPLDHGTATVDHVVAKSRGGSNRWENFALSCEPCNYAKGSRDWGEPPFRPRELLAWIRELRRSEVQSRSLWSASLTFGLNLPQRMAES